MNRIKKIYSPVQLNSEKDKEIRNTLLIACEKNNEQPKKMPQLALAGTFATIMVFVFSVNVSPSFATFISQIPFFDKLVESVTYSKSLSTAVDNEFVQVVGQTQNKDDVIITIQHLIVDQKEVNIFYTLGKLNWGTDKRYEIRSELICVESGEMLESNNYMPTSGLRASEDRDKLHHISYTLEDMPSELGVNFSVYEYDDPTPHWTSFFQFGSGNTEGTVTDTATEGQLLTEMTFILEFDPDFTDEGTFYEVNQQIEMNGQKFTITSLESYPTQMLLEVLADEDNSLFL